MPVEIRKLIIKGVVHEKKSTDVLSTKASSKSMRREHEKEKTNLRKFKKQVLGECKEMIESIIERKTSRY